jgi:hypothetical protein
MEPTEKDIEEAKLAAGGRDLHQIEVEDGDAGIIILACAPSRVEWMKYVHDLTSTEDVNKKAQAGENAVLAASKWPDRAVIKDFFQQKFGALPDVLNELSKLVGADAKVRSKKL